MFRGYVGVETLARGAASAPLFPRLREDGEVQIAERLRPRETPPSKSPSRRPSRGRWVRGGANKSSSESVARCSIISV